MFTDLFESCRLQVPAYERLLETTEDVAEVRVDDRRVAADGQSLEERLLRSEEDAGVRELLQERVDAREDGRCVLDAAQGRDASPTQLEEIGDGDYKRGNQRITF